MLISAAGGSNVTHTERPCLVCGACSYLGSDAFITSPDTASAGLQLYYWWYFSIFFYFTSFRAFTSRRRSRTHSPFD